MEEEGGTASLGLQRDQEPGLTGWTTPLKKAASDGVGLSGNESGKGPQAAQKRPSLRFWACCVPQLTAGEKEGQKAVGTHPHVKMVSGSCQEEGSPELSQRPRLGPKDRNCGDEKPHLRWQTRKLRCGEETWTQILGENPRLALDSPQPGIHCASMASNMLLTERVTEAPETREKVHSHPLNPRHPTSSLSRGPVIGQAGS